MSKSLAYTVEVIPVPADLASWVGSLSYLTNNPTHMSPQINSAPCTELRLRLAVFIGACKSDCSTELQTKSDSLLQHMIPRNTSDTSYIATTWLIHQVLERRLNIQHILRVSFDGRARSQRLVLLLSHDRYLCECCMGINIGIPCRHYFAVLRGMRSARMCFHIGLVRNR